MKDKSEKSKEQYYQELTTLVSTMKRRKKGFGEFKKAVARDIPASVRPEILQMTIRSGIMKKGSNFSGLLTDIWKEEQKIHQKPISKVPTPMSLQAFPEEQAISLMDTHEGNTVLKLVEKTGKIAEKDKKKALAAYNDHSKEFKKAYPAYFKAGEKAVNLFMKMVQDLMNTGDYNRTSAINKVADDHKSIRGFSKATFYRRTAPELKRSWTHRKPLPPPKDEQSEKSDINAEPPTAVSTSHADNKAEVIEKTGESNYTPAGAESRNENLDRPKVPIEFTRSALRTYEPTDFDDAKVLVNALREQVKELEGDRELDMISESPMPATLKLECGHRLNINDRYKKNKIKCQICKTVQEISSHYYPLEEDPTIPSADVMTDADKKKYLAFIKENLKLIGKDLFAEVDKLQIELNKLREENNRHSSLATQFSERNQQLEKSGREKDVIIKALNDKVLGTGVKQPQQPQ